MTHRILLIFVFLLTGASCGVKGAPMPRKDEMFIRPTIKQQKIEKAETDKSEKLIKKKEKR